MPITDLTNTTWRFNRTLTRSDISYDVSGTVSNAAYSPYGFDYFGYNSDYGVDVFGFFYHSIPSPYEFGDGIGYIPQNSLGYDEGWYFGNANDPTSYIPTDAPIVTITGGTDVTNTSLISLLQENATQILTYTITTVLTNISATGDTTIEDGGEASVVLTPSKGLSLPSSISVVGASYAYIPSSGLVVLSNPTSDVTITASAVVSVDISTLDDYPSVTPGEHTLKIYTKANLYEDSDESTAVTFIKLSPPTTEVITSSVYTAEGAEYDTIYDLYAVDENGTIYYLGETLPKEYEYSVDSNGVLTLHNASYTLSEGVVTIQ